jgi:hypothetical protein
MVQKTIPKKITKAPAKSPISKKKSSLNNTTATIQKPASSQKLNSVAFPNLTEISTQKNPTPQTKGQSVASSPQQPSQQEGSKHLTHLHLWPYARLMAAMNLVAGFFMGAILTIIIWINGTIPNTSGDPSIKFYNYLGWWNIPVQTIGYGILGLLTALFLVYVYNLLGKNQNGITCILAPKNGGFELKSFGVLRLGLLYMFLMAVSGILAGIIFGIFGSLTAKNVLLGIALVFLFIILFTIIYAVMGFISGVAFSFIYNFLAKKMGGIEFEMLTTELKRIRVWPLTRLYAIVFLIFGIIFGFFVALIVAFFAIVSSGAGAAVAAFFLVSIISIILFTALGFICGAFGAWLYNVFAKLFGGVHLQLD